MGKKITFSKVKTFIEVNKYAFKNTPIKYIFLVILNLINVVNTLVMLKFFEFSTNAAYRLFTKSSTGFNYERRVVIYFTLALILLYIVGVIKEIMIKDIYLELSYKFEKDLNSKLSNICWDYYESHKTNVKIHEVRNKSLESIKELVSSMMFYISTTISMGIYAFFLAQINLIVVGIYLGLLFLTGKICNKIMKDIDKIWEQIQPLNQKQKYFFGISGDKVGHQEYKFNRLYSYVRDKWEEYYDEEYKLRLKIFKKLEITIQTSRIIINMPYILMIIFVSYEIVIGKHEIGFLSLCFMMLNNIVNSIGALQWKITHNKIQCKFAKSFFEVLGLDEENQSISEATVESEIKFSNIKYAYPQSESNALKGMDMQIKKGEKIAVVGENGSGKTTFTNLLMALTEKYNGEVSIMGDHEKDKGKIQQKLRNSVSCILQDFAQYKMTIRENIEMGNVKHQFTEEEIMELLDKVGLKEYVGSLSQGIETKLGNIHEGIELSKGQWQRLAIARLLANSKSRIWILDEPTAYLDPISEIEIYDLIYSLSEDRTVFFISHRLGFAKKADRIVVFNDGKVVEEGVHKELINKHGLYERMYKNQEEWYVA